MYNLNKEQLKAVEHIGSPLLIVAGAGTGKTTVITQKIGWLVERELAKSDEILALTFTEKAAGEMEERADKLMPYGYVDMWIMTFHSFCEKILKQHGLDIGLPTDFKLLNEFQQWALIKKNLDKFDLDYYRPMGNPTKFISALLKHFSKAKDEVINPADYLSYAEELKENIDAMLSGGNLKRRRNDKFQITNDKQISNFKFKISNLTNNDGEITREIAEQEIARINEVANAYHVYQNLLLENSALDFGDLINYTLKLFQERPGILEKFRKQFKYILIDEFQDTNWAQYELVKMLAPKGENLTVVGDDDQSIFRFRGASMSNILQFKQDFKNAEEIVLTENYRSAQNILDTAYKFIQLNNPNRLEAKLLASNEEQATSNKIDKRLISNIKEDGLIEIIQGADLHDEVNRVIEKIAELKISDKDANWNDFAILVRANNSAKEFVNALEIAGLPYIFLASKGLYSQPIIMDTIAYLNLLDNYHESTALYRVLNIPVFNFSHEEIIGFLQLAKKKSWSLYETIKYLSNFSEEPGIKIKNIIDLIAKHTALARGKSAGETVIAFLHDSGYIKYLENLGGQKTKEAMRVLNAFIKRIKEFESGANDKSVKSFLIELSLEIESGEDGSLAHDPEEGPEMIKILTVHAAKGLEFKYVFIVNMVDLRFPTTERKDPIALPDALIKEIIPEGDTHLEEERRLFYVAMTRAKHGLYFSWAPDYGGTRKKKSSRFLSELQQVTSNNLQVANNDEKILHNVERITHNTPQIIVNDKRPVYELPKFYSYTQLQSYDKCPHQYFRDHVLKIPKPGKHFFSFGQTMHLTLQKFFGMIMASQNAVQESLFDKPHPNPLLSKERENAISVDVLLKLYEESWIGDWFQDKKQKEEYYKKGREILKEFWQKHEGNWPKVIGLEQSFKLQIGGHLIYGKIDRVDDLGPPSSNGSGEVSEARVQIVDYKTGQIKDENKITTDQKYQLLLYQLAAEEVLKRKPVNLQFYYLENNSEINFLGEQKDMEKMQQWVMDTIKKIEESIKKGYFPHSSEPCRFCSKSDEVGEFLMI
ncbi:MAG: ATP-dependent DNA helicase [Patescibacteria group bacterium]|jgi:DNA helicase-2/ATP-dependent DNA helicase PcrA